MRVNVTGSCIQLFETADAEPENRALVLARHGSTDRERI